MLILRLLLTFIAAVAGLVVGGIVTALFASVFLGSGALDRAFNSDPIGGLALSGIAVYVSFSIAAAVPTWLLSAKWLTGFVASQVGDLDGFYRERGGARYPGTMGFEVNATWPFASLVVGRESIRIKVLGTEFIADKVGITRLSVFNGLFSSGIEILTVNHIRLVFWSFDVPRLSSKLVSLGYEVHGRSA